MIANGGEESGFRPLAGFWFLKYAERDAKGISSRGFRPLAGFWFLKENTR